MSTLAVDLVCAALGGPAYEPERVDTCCFTGRREPCVPRRRILGASFLDQGLLRAPASPWIGVATATAMRHPPTRKSSWFCDGRVFRPLKKPDARALVLDESSVPADHWAGYVTTSYKKHGALRAPVNGPGGRRWLFETQPVDAWGMRAWYERLLAARVAGVSRGALESLEPSPRDLRAVGVRGWTALVRWASPRRADPRFALALYLLPAEAEVRAMRKEA